MEKAKIDFGEINSTISKLKPKISNTVDNYNKINEDKFKMSKGYSIDNINLQIEKEQKLVKETADLLQDLLNYINNVSKSVEDVDRNYSKGKI